MSAFCCKQSSLLLARLALNSRIAVTSDLGFLQKFRFLELPVNFFSHERKFTSLSGDNIQEKHSFTVIYLIDSCGLSQQNAMVVSKKVHFENSDRPDAVLLLLKEHGCDTAHISKMVRKYPKLLLADPESNLRPKLEFFQSVGLSGSDLLKFLTSTKLLACGLENRIIPIYNFLRNIVGYNVEPSVFLKSCCWWVPGPVVQRHFVLNLQHLEKLGAPKDVIVSSINLYTTVFFKRSDLFAEKTKKLIDLGLEPTKLNFVQGLAATTQMSESTWKHKIEIYKRWGWSDKDLNMAFRKTPVFICYSEEKIMNVMDFLVNKIGICSSSVARVPIIFTFSLEKRIIPRSSVVRFLQMKGFVKKELHMNSFLKLSEKSFLDKYVTKYQEEVPKILDLYQGKVNIRELGVRSEDMNWQTYL